MSDAILSLSKSLVDLTRFKVISKIGAGGFGKVYLMENPEDNQQYAVKFIHGGFKDFRTKQVFMREIETQLACGQARVTTFRGYFLPDPNPEARKFRFPALVMDYIKNGSLQDYLTDPEMKKNMAPTILSKILFGIAVKIRHLHRKNIIHRDLKPENILLDDEFNPLISDFGLARFIAQEEEGPMTMEQGTMTYMAPEVIESENYDKKVDVYSFAMMANFIVTGEEPFKDIGYYKAAAFVRSGERPTIPEYIPDYTAGLIEQCWAQDPQDRPDFEKIVEVMTLFECVVDGTDLDEYNEYRKKILSEFDIEWYL
ncbi:hypothetical protein TRFO_15104 [Tritrichomonas foetus]|uniref:Protein kinase domain-containing protein n=1 Tax=Tritrichomonas foetus TaxID=1144522 RepID=A0A1J4KXW5_9EUKA|nr:hypothetical protein TRFO_15104 [Tritrichomonas foetus]|eukprot:OHT14550.1 hypothetical protein TRFO_15104 [Tritrichomonas foetus]